MSGGNSERRNKVPVGCFLSLDRVDNRDQSTGQRLVDIVDRAEAAPGSGQQSWDIVEEASFMTVADEVIQLMKERGGAAYFGEYVSQLEHALQAAWLATQAGTPRELTIAALLHDIGHLLHNLAEAVADDGIDTRHEIAGYEWILTRFGPKVAEPVRHHVAAKRYLCRTEPEYLARLSPASVQSLALQGGPFSEERAREFEALPYYREAVMLRRWDDEAKTPGLAVPALEEYRQTLSSCAMFNS
jgi:phosphonate degradation associated HDIG domain protein